jgi:Tfp pilus assembly protein PilO
LVRSLGGLSARSRRVVFLLLTLSVLLGAWQTWLGPERLLLESRRSKRDTAIADLARVRLATAGLPALQREVQAIEARLAEQTPGGSGTPETETLLEVVHELATRSGLELIGFTQAPAAGTPATATSGQRVQLALDGGFHDVVAFLARLSASGRLASAPEVTIKPHTKPTSPGAFERRALRTVSVTVLAETSQTATPAAVADAFLDTDAITDTRDPFAPPSFSMSASSDGVGTPGQHAGTGLGGLSANDVIVTGIVRAGDVVSAILQGPDRRTFVARPQDRLLDATIKSVDAGGVVFVVRPPRGGAPHSSEIRKPLGNIPGAVR